MNKYNEALDVAIIAHQGQTRKIGNVPYLFHVMDTAVILHNYGFEEKVVIAGLLHDVVEKSKITSGDLKKQFGESVSEIVDECTATKGTSWKDKKERYLRKIKNNSAKAVICADKISYLKETYRWQKEIGEKVWKIFKTGKNGQRWFHNKLVVILEFDHPIYREYLKCKKKIFDK